MAEFPRILVHIKFKDHLKYCYDGAKGVFFQKVRFIFQISKSQKKKIQKTILSLKFKFPANNTLLLLAGNFDFKFKIVFLEFFFGRFGGLKNESYFLKKSHL